MKIVVVTGSLPAPSLIAHRQALHIVQNDAKNNPMLSCLTILNAHLKKLGSLNVIVPVSDQYSQRLLTFALALAVDPISAKPAGPVVVAPVAPAPVTVTAPIQAPTTTSPSRPLGGDGPEWIDADSSNLKRFRYDASTGELSVVFNTGRTYAYNKVTAEEYAALKQANRKTKPTQGEYFNQFIKGTRDNPLHPVREVK